MFSSLEPVGLDRTNERPPSRLTAEQQAEARKLRREAERGELQPWPAWDESPRVRGACAHPAIAVAVEGLARPPPSRYPDCMARVLTWDGKKLPKELRKLPAGRYAVEPIDNAPKLTEAEEEGLREALRSIEEGRVTPGVQVHREMRALIQQRRRKKTRAR
jgi:hypothetical protein